MFIFDEGSSTSRLHCSTKQLLDNLLWEMKTEIKKALAWKRNGEVWADDKSRIDKGMFALDFKKVDVTDMGFYTCELDLLGGGKVILKAFSLIGMNNKVDKK